jgi:hypothetical protein
LFGRHCQPGHPAVLHNAIGWRRARALPIIAAL